jgi:predicted MFS family arabinose efflux permease
MAIFIVISQLILPFILGLAGVRKTTFVSGILFVGGNIICIIAENVIYLSAGYALLGLSCGTFVLIFNSIIGSQKKAEDMNSGFAHFNASYLAGVNVGVVFGAIIAQFFPYNTLFWFASGIAVLFFVIIIFSLRSNLFTHFYESTGVKKRLRNVSLDSQMVKVENKDKFVFINFLFKPVVICILLLALVPYVISVSFVEYFMPIFGMESGLLEANIGQLMLLSGLFAILFGASLCQIMEKKLPILLSVLFPLFLISGALFLFSLNVSISMLIIAIILMAIVNIFASTNIQTYFSLLYQSERIASVKALGAYAVMENMSMAVGPIIFSYILAYRIDLGMKLLAGLILGCTIIFAVVSMFSVKWNNKTLDKITQ